MSTRQPEIVEAVREEIARQIGHHVEDSKPKIDAFVIDPRYTPPTLAQIERWLAWCAAPGDPDAGTLSDEQGD
jgi:flagellar biosynthesis component FlhA